MKATLVPTGRLGTLLVDHRTCQGWTVGEVAERSRYFSEGQLERIEQGLVPLHDDSVDAVLNLYGIDLTDGTHRRSKLVVDLSRRSITQSQLRFEGEAAQRVLERYVCLLYLLRDQPFGSPLQLRTDDVEILARSLGRSEPQLRADIETVIADPDLAHRAERLSLRRRLPSVGLLVGSAPAGSLVLIGAVLPDELAEHREGATTSNEAGSTFQDLARAAVDPKRGATATDSNEEAMKAAL